MPEESSMNVRRSKVALEKDCCWPVSRKISTAAMIMATMRHDPDAQFREAHLLGIAPSAIRRLLYEFGDIGIL